MSRPTPASVTDVPCSCGFLAGLAKRELLPVRFDVDLNEYHLVARGEDGAEISAIFYHCPMCGGVPAISRRRERFAAVSNEEMERLDSLTCNFGTEGDLVRALGTPDKDEVVHIPESHRISDLHEGHEGGGANTVRVLTYTRLSPTADVQFSIYGKGKVERAIMAKELRG